MDQRELIQALTERSAMQKELYGTPNFGWGFRTEQTEFQFQTYGEFPKPF